MPSRRFKESLTTTQVAALSGHTRNFSEKKRKKCHWIIENLFKMFITDAHTDSVPLTTHHSANALTTFSVSSRQSQGMFLPFATQPIRTMLISNNCIVLWIALIFNDDNTKNRYVSWQPGELCCQEIASLLVIASNWNDSWRKMRILTKVIIPNKSFQSQNFPWKTIFTQIACFCLWVWTEWMASRFLATETNIVVCAKWFFINVWAISRSR